MIPKTSSLRKVLVALAVHALTFTTSEIITKAFTIVVVQPTKHRRTLPLKSKSRDDIDQSNTPNHPSFESSEGVIGRQMRRGLLVLGLGQVGRHVAQLAQPYFSSVVGTVRSNFEVNEHSNVNCSLLTIPFDIETIQAYLPHTSHILITIPPPSKSPNQELDETWISTLSLGAIYQSIMDQLQYLPCWIGIISTAGVYGDHQGRWITEHTDLLYDRDLDGTARRYHEHEEQWKKRIVHHHQAGQQQHTLRIFRCAGIYGSHQSALHTAWSQGQQRREEGHFQGRTIQTTVSITSEIHSAQEQPTNTADVVPTDVINRIHISDLSRAVLSSMLQFSASYNNDDSNLSPGRNDDIIRVYNLADDLPESRRIVLEYAYHLLQSKGFVLPYAPTNNDPRDSTIKRSSSFSSSSPSSSSRQLRRRRLDCKRVSNQRMKEELLQPFLHYPQQKNCGLLLYPTYREGLTQILLDSLTPWWQNNTFHH